MGHPRDSACESWPSSSNCDAAVLLKAKTLQVEWREFGPHPDLISQYAAELVRARVDVIATAGEEATRAAQQATKTIPIVAVA